MSLGLLGDYGSGSEISDSDGEFEQVSSDNQNTTKNDSNATWSKTDPSVSSGTNEEEGVDKEGDPLSYIQDDASSSDNDSSSEDTPDDKNTTTSLPLPDLDQLTSPTSQCTTTFSSVFSNPYKEAEEAKLAMLKHHVSDFAPDEKRSSRDRTKQHRFQGSCGKRKSRSAAQHGSVLAGHATHAPTDGTDSQGLFNDDDSCVVLGEMAHGGWKRKQRSGVSGTLVPPKKFMKSYGKVQAEERPWTVKTS